MAVYYLQVLFLSCFVLTCLFRYSFLIVVGVFSWGAWLRGVGWLDWRWLVVAGAMWLGLVGVVGWGVGWWLGVGVWVGWCGAGCGWLGCFGGGKACYFLFLLRFWFGSGVG